MPVHQAKTAAGQLPGQANAAYTDGQRTVFRYVCMLRVFVCACVCQMYVSVPTSQCTPHRFPSNGGKRLETSA
jgi:hypothetical protein